MMNFKNHKGFTITETLLAMAIVGITLTPILIMHSMIITQIGKSSRTYDAILLAKHLLFQARQKQNPQSQDFSMDNKDIELDATLSYVLEKGIDKQSALASLLGLHQEIITVSWTEAGQKKYEKLITYIYKKPEQKKS